MIEIERKVLERSPDGGYQFTKYGEFLSYYHTHLQIFNKLVDQKNLSDKEKKELKDSIKAFMKSHIKQTDHFFNYTRDFAGFLQITQEDLTAYMNKNFLDVLHKVQEKLKQQELENTAKTRQFSTFTEEIVATLGEILPAGHRYVYQDALLVIENIQTGEITRPKGILSAIKEEQEKEEEKKRQLQEQLQRLRDKSTPDTFSDEQSILKQIVDSFGIITETPLELKEDILPVKLKPQLIVEPEKKEKSLLDDVEDLELEEHSTSESEQEKEEDYYPSEVEEVDRLNLKEGLEEEQEESSLADFLDEIESTPKEEPDETDLFLFRDYTEISKTIQNFKSKNDVQGYNQWLKTASPVAKVFNSIKTNLSKEAAGSNINWNEFFVAMESRTGLEIKVLQKLKIRIEHLDKVKIVLDKCVQELKKQPPQVIQFLKIAWPKISNSFRNAPKYEEIEPEIAEILAEAPSENIRKPIQKLLTQAIEKLKTVPF